MKKTELLRLISNKDVFYHVSYLLVSLGLVENPTDQDPSISRLILTKDGETLLGAKPSPVEESLILNYRALFPPYKKGDAKLVAENLAWLVNTYGCTEEQIISATNAYLRTVEDKKYCQQADFFIYKNMTNGAVRNTILTFLSDKEEIETDEEGYGWQVI